MELKDLEVYRIARQMSNVGWELYNELNKENRYSIGHQFLSSVDSIGANIAEGFGRYHYLDSVKFYYNARGSLWESKHWVELLRERGLVTEKASNRLLEDADLLGIKLNSFISSAKERARKK